jgi:hypothetical protein
VRRVHSESADILVLKLRCNKLSAYIEIPAPPSSKRRPHFETRTCLGENKTLFMDLETEARNDCAGEGQQRFNSQTYRPTSTKPQQSDIKENLICARSGLTSRLTGRMTVGCNLTLTLTYRQSGPGGHELPSCIRCARVAEQGVPEPLSNGSR